MSDDDWKETAAGLEARATAAGYFLLCLKLLGQGFPEEAARCVSRVRWREEAAAAGVPREIIDRTERFLADVIDAIDAGREDRVAEMMWEVMELWY